MAEVILKYAANVYQAKIERFNSLDSELDARLEALEGLRDKMRDVWYDEKTDGYINAINISINKVKQASAAIKRLSREYEGIIAEQTRVSGAIDQVVGDVTAAAEKTIDVVGDVAKIAGTIAPLL